MTAPEVIRGEKYTKAIDWWSVGTIIFEMLAGIPPFFTEDQSEACDLSFPLYSSSTRFQSLTLFLSQLLHDLVS